MRKSHSLSRTDNPYGPRLALNTGFFRPHQYIDRCARAFGTFQKNAGLSKTIFWNLENFNLHVNIPVHFHLVFISTINRLGAISQENSVQKYVEKILAVNTGNDNETKLKQSSRLLETSPFLLFGASSALISTFVLLPAGWQILVLILGIGAVHVRRFLLGIVLQNRIVLLLLRLSSFHRHRVQLAIQATLHVRHAAHLCGFVVGFLAITVVQNQEKNQGQETASRFTPEVQSRCPLNTQATRKSILLVQKTSLKKVWKIRTSFRESLCRLAIF